jgi:hypothetical protein
MFLTLFLMTSCQGVKSPRDEGTRGCTIHLASIILPTENPGTLEPYTKNKILRVRIKKYPVLPLFTYALVSGLFRCSTIVQ